jgi:serine phosphatase RsbU (regulator of sigma subunit)
LTTPGAIGAQRRRRVVHTISIVVLLIGLVVTGVVALGVEIAHRNNEKRLLDQRAAEAGTVLSAAIPSLVTPLSTASELAEATKGEADAFEHVMSPRLTDNGGTWASASLWSTSAPSKPIVVVGKQPRLARSSPADIERVFARAERTKQLAVVDGLDDTSPHIGYAFASEGSGADYVVYAEVPIESGRRAQVESNSAFSDLGYAIYLGDTPRASQLIAASAGSDPLRRRHTSETVPFGDTNLLLVVTPRHELGGGLLASLPWVIAIGGTLFSLAAAFITERLARQRDLAERFAQENARLYAQQRTVAHTLQQSLLPANLPYVAGVECAARYLPGVDGVDVGGDWYDVMELDSTRALFVVGDVSGRGVHAATVMASLRYSMHAYAAQGDSPATILDKSARLLSLDREGHFATVLCGVIDVSAGTVTLANAGHPDPLLIDHDSAAFVAADRGVPVGIDQAATYRTTTIKVPPGATMLAFTDGLIERRGEIIDVGLERLRAAVPYDSSLDDVMTTVIETMAPNGPNDDIALIGMRWQN